MAPIHKAAENGNLNRVRQLVNQGVAVNTRNVDRMTPLHEAASKGHLTVVRFLLNHGAHINPRNRYGLTPLHYAAQWSKHPNVVKELVQRGAKLSYRNNRGMTPLELARFSRVARINATRSALGARSVRRMVNKYRSTKKGRLVPAKNIAEKVFSPERVRTMMNKYGNNWLNKV